LGSFEEKDILEEIGGGGGKEVYKNNKNKEKK
jgi:hypothetical protein